MKRIRSAKTGYRYTGSEQNNGLVPQVKISGQWLMQIAFEIGSHMEIEISYGKLTLKLIEEHTPASNFVEEVINIKERFSNDLTGSFPGDVQE